MPRAFWSQHGQVFRKQVTDDRLCYLHSISTSSWAFRYVLTRGLRPFQAGPLVQCRPNIWFIPPYFANGKVVQRPLAGPPMHEELAGDLSSSVPYGAPD